MRVLVGFFVMVSLLAIPFHSSAQEMTKEQVAKVEAEVLAFADAWVEVWEENSCEKGERFLHPDRLAFIQGGKALNSSEWLESCATSLETRAGFSGQLLDATVHVLTPKAAVVVLSLEATYRSTDGTSRHYPMSAQHGLVELMEAGWVFTTFSYSNGSYDSGEGG